MNSRDIIAKLEADGWVHTRTVGSHWQFKHPAKTGVGTVPHPKRDMPVGTLANIEKVSGVTLRAKQ